MDSLITEGFTAFFSSFFGSALSVSFFVALFPEDLVSDWVL